MPHEFETKTTPGVHPDHQFVLEMTRLDAGRAGCDRCGGRVRKGPAYFTMKDHVLIVSILATVGWVILSLHQVQPGLAWTMGWPLIVLVGMALFERRYLGIEVLCLECDRRRVERRRWGPTMQRFRIGLAVFLGLVIFKPLSILLIISLR